jgi:hypothetical protein
LNLYVWIGHVARMEMINAYKILVGNLRGRDHSEKDGKIILKWILRK